MFCTNCGSKLPDDVKFCTQCGAPVAKVITRSELEQQGDGQSPAQSELEQSQPAAAADQNSAEDAVAPSELEAETAVLVEAEAGADAESETEALVESEADAETETLAGAEGATSVDASTGVEADADAEAGAADGPTSTEAADEAARAEAAADAAAAASALWSDPGQEEATTVIGQDGPQAVLSSGNAARQVPWQQPASQQEPSAPGVPQQSMPTQVAPRVLDQEGGQQPASAVQQPRKKKPVALIAGIAVLALAAVVALCVFVVPRFLDAAGPTVTYGQTDPVQCSVVTRIRPRDAEGNELTSYVVSLVERTADRQDRTSADDGIADAVAQIRVTGNNGFTMEDFGDDIADGDYYLVIEPSDSSDDSSSDQRIPIHYERDNPDADSEVVVTPPAPESDEPASDGENQDGEDAQDEAEFTEEQLAYAHYYLKCQELIDAYGPAGTTNLYDGQMTAMTGLALAKLIDFDDDGLNELLVSYNAVQIGTDAASADEVYPVEVWDYQDGELVQVYEGNAPYTNGGAYFLDLYEYNDLPVICAVWYDMQVDNASLVDEYTGYFSQVSETLDAIAVRDSFFNYDTGENSVTYTLDGESATEEEWNDFEDDLDHTTHYDLALFNNAVEAESTDDDECETLYGEDLRAATEDTFAELQEGAGDALDTVDAATGDDSYDYEIVEEDVTYTSSQGEGMEWEATSTWCYPQFTLADGSTTPALDSLNAQLKESFDQDVANAQSWTFESGEVQIQVHRDTVTYHEGTIVCVRSDRSGFTGGAHGTESVTGTFYDLDTGQQVGIETATGVSLDELKSAAVTAVLDYVAAQPNGTLSTDEESLNTLIDEERFYADENGIVVALWPYEIGSYADGVQLVYVYAFDGDSIVGTNAGSFEWGN